MKADEHFHTGIIVDDFEGTLARLSTLFGYVWCTEIDAPATVRLDDGVTEVDIRYTYSAHAPHLEIIQSIPGTFWQPAPGSGIHHLGYWSDLETDTKVLEEAGYVHEATGLGPDGTPYWSIYRPETGPRIELINRSASQRFMERWWAAGAAGRSR